MVEYREYFVEDYSTLKVNSNILHFFNKYFEKYLPLVYAPNNQKPTC
jgi:hypothetical protein